VTSSSESALRKIKQRYYWWVRVFAGGCHVNYLGQVFRVSVGLAMVLGAGWQARGAAARSSAPGGGSVVTDADEPRVTLSWLVEDDLAPSDVQALLLGEMTAGEETLDVAQQTNATNTPGAANSTSATMQSPTPAPAGTSASAPPVTGDGSAAKTDAKTEEEPPKRMFGMIPDFENTNNTPVNQKPLSVREKYVLAWHQSTDFSAHVGAAFAAGLQQWGNGQPRYGEGWGAYGKRFAAAEGDQMSSSWLIYGVFPSLLHDDPRYFRLGKGSPPVRVWYAITRTFVTRRDNGTQRFNYSTVSGQLVSCAISTAYYPEIDRATSRVFSNWGLDLVGFSAYNVLSEYYPDLIKALFHHGKNGGAGSGS